MKIRLTTIRLLLSGALLMMLLMSPTRPLLAHHGANLFDMSKAVPLKGTITRFYWGNPHNQVEFDVKDEKGEVAHWVAYTEPPLVMLERGWSVKSMKAGDEVTVYVFPAKNGAPVANLAKIVFADGRELVANQIPGAAPAAR